MLRVALTWLLVLLLLPVAFRLLAAWAAFVLPMP